MSDEDKEKRRQIYENIMSIPKIIKPEDILNEYKSDLYSLALENGGLLNTKVISEFRNLNFVDGEHNYNQYYRCTWVGYVQGGVYREILRLDATLPSSYFPILITPFGMDEMGRLINKKESDVIIVENADELNEKINWILTNDVDVRRLLGFLIDESSKWK